MDWLLMKEIIKLNEELKNVVYQLHRIANELEACSQVIPTRNKTSKKKKK